MVLAHGADLKPGASDAPLREGVDYTRVCPLGPVFGCLCQFWFLNMLILLRRVSSVVTAHHGGLLVLIKHQFHAPTYRVNV
jgi:hypothetical protein